MLLLELLWDGLTIAVPLVLLLTVRYWNAGVIYYRSYCKRKRYAE
jgi:hypothetical protein